MSDDSGLLFRELTREKERLLGTGQIRKQKSKISVSDSDNPPFSIPKNWCWVRLGDVSVIQEGPGIRKHQYRDEGVQFLTVTNILEGRVDLAKSVKHISNEEFESKYSHFQIDKGDIVVACSGGSWGKSAVFEDDAQIILNTSTLRLRFFGDLSDNRYLYYLTKTSFFKNQLASHSTGQQPNFGFSHYSIAFIPLPPLAEQMRIVAILDEAFGAIERAKRIAEINLGNAVELFDSYLNRVFTEKGEGWEVTSLSDVCSIESKLVDPKQDEFIDLPHVGAGNMISKSDQLVDVLTAREEGLISNKYTFDNTMVLYSKIRPYLMKVSRPSFVGLCSADVYPLSPKHGTLDRDFLFYVLLSKDFTDYAISGSARAGMPKVNRNHLFAYRLRLPRIEDQQRIVEQADSLVEKSRSLAEVYRQKSNALEEIRQSILQKAFTGKLTAKSPELEAVP